jgi:hypothetical protein
MNLLEVKLQLIREGYIYEAGSDDDRPVGDAFDAAVKKSTEESKKRIADHEIEREENERKHAAKSAEILTNMTNDLNKHKKEAEVEKASHGESYSYQSLLRLIKHEEDMIERVKNYSK